MKINPNNFFNRELNILPPHFVNTVVKAHEADIEKMRNGYTKTVMVDFQLPKMSNLKVTNPETAQSLVLRNQATLPCLHCPEKLR